jgi:serum/glucocorticoid-regulated kinase 2
MEKDSKTKTFCGTPAYISPDMLSMRGAGKDVDLYGIGTMAYFMLEGTPPFHASDIPTLYRNIKAGRLHFKRAGGLAEGFVRALMDKNPRKRLGSASKEEIKRHPFFEGLDWAAMEGRSGLGPLRNCQF